MAERLGARRSVCHLYSVETETAAVGAVAALPAGALPACAEARFAAAAGTGRGELAAGA
jgi:hypothetical protein